MRWLAGPILAAVLLLAGCTSPFTPTTTSDLPEVRAVIDARAYDSDGNNRTDGIALTLRSARPTTPLIGSDVVIERNGDSNVTTWLCPERASDRCQSNKGLLSWAPDETIYLRGLPGPNRLNLVVKERFVYNTTVRVDETRDTEVWAVFTVRSYDSDGNQTMDGIEIGLVDSDKAPFRAGEVKVLVNKVEVPVFTDPKRTRELGGGSWSRNGKLFLDGFIGENRVELLVRATKFELGTFLVGE